MIFNDLYVFSVAEPGTAETNGNMLSLVYSLFAYANDLTSGSDVAWQCKCPLNWMSFLGGYDC